MGLKVVQINLQHSRTATDNLSVFLSEENVDIALIQEPWVRSTEVSGLSLKNYNLYYKRIPGNPRSCIVAKKHLNIFFIPSYSSSDVTVIEMEADGVRIKIASIYMAHDQPAPPDEVRRLVLNNKNSIVLLGCDANARHSLWGSTETNDRGESLYEFITNTNLTVCNRGNTPTFTFPSTECFRGWAEVLDVTLLSENTSVRVENWRVSSEKSFSDHSWILYHLDLEVDPPPPYRNPLRTNWKWFKNIVNNGIGRIPIHQISLTENIESRVTTLEKTLSRAYKTSCPIKYSKKSYPPWWSNELSKLREEARKNFNLSYSTGNWELYRKSRRQYKKAIRAAKKESWRDFCSSIESTRGSARLSRCLSKDHSMDSWVKRPDGTWTSTTEESLELLLDTHFPGCSDHDSDRGRIRRSRYDPQHPDDVIVTKEKIAWAIGSFSPFKSPGPDGIFPKMLQETLDCILPWLLEIFKACLNLGYIPNSWKLVRVVFIPKVGRRGHESAKDYRPISLSSFLLKTFERLLDIHIRSSLEGSCISTAQHAYLKGKSTETALHEVIRTIEGSLENKQYTMAAFLDIEGAFNNVSTNAIQRALIDLGVDSCISNWIISMLETRIISANMGNINITKRVHRGTPQGGVLSPLLWLCVISKILVKLDGGGMKVVAYADDVVLMASGLCLNTISGIIQRALGELNSWATGCGLSLNPRKTELMLFTTRYKVPNFTPPHINGQTLSLSPSAKYLGVILDSKLSWKLNIEERVRKAEVALYACKRMLGRRWGLQPRHTLWLYKTVIRPILSYGAVVWWKALGRAYNIKLLDRIQRSACAMTVGAIKSCPREALNALTHVIPIDLHIKKMATMSAFRLNEAGLWKGKTYGHANLLLQQTQYTSERTDYIVPTVTFNRNFATLFPSRKEWSKGFSLNSFDTTVYTDGSKMDCGVGAGIYSHRLKIEKSVRLPKACSVFQAEVLAIGEACRLLIADISFKDNIAILSDSQAAIQSLDSAITTSKLVEESRNCLTTLSENHNVTLIWVPGHRDIEGNEKADKLAREGSATKNVPEESVFTPFGAIRNAVSSKYLQIAGRRWKDQTKCKISKTLWPTYNLKQTSKLINMKRRDAWRLTAVITGFWSIGEQAAKMGIPHNTHCRSCKQPEKKETIFHFLCECPTLWKERMSTLGKPLFESLEQLSGLDVNNLIRFLNRTDWI